MKDHVMGRWQHMACSPSHLQGSVDGLCWSIYPYPLFEPL
jgi:hypothetical protein